MKALIGATILFLAIPMFTSAQNAEPQYRGYLFLGVGSGTNLPSFEHVGGGGEVLLFKGLGVGGELGAMGRPGEGWGVFSIDPSYHFLHASRKSKVVPFVEGGYTRFFASNDVPAKLFNFGGGIHYWLLKRLGLRLEFRDHVHHVSSPFPRYGSGHTFHYWGLRIGLTLR